MNWFEMRQYGEQRQQELLGLAARIAAARSAAGRSNCRSGLRSVIARMAGRFRTRKSGAFQPLPSESLAGGCRDA